MFDIANFTSHIANCLEAEGEETERVERKDMPREQTEKGGKMNRRLTYT